MTTARLATLGWRFRWSALLIRNQVRNDATWKPAFDADEATRRANGCMGEQHFRNSANPNEVVLLLAWDRADRARLFALSDDLREAMVRSGVTGHPSIWVLETIDETLA